MRRETTRAYVPMFLVAAGDLGHALLRKQCMLDSRGQRFGILHTTRAFWLFIVQLAARLDDSLVRFMGDFERDWGLLERTGTCGIGLRNMQVSCELCLHSKLCDDQRLCEVQHSSQTSITQWLTIQRQPAALSIRSSGPHTRKSHSSPKVRMCIAIRACRVCPISPRPCGADRPWPEQGHDYCSRPQYP